jgi:WhiB family transcriptional regulator, redox-sensing transcriptional regulator
LLNSYVRLQEAIVGAGGVVCEQVPFAFFYDDEDSRTDEREKVRVAREICSECPVRMLCLDYAMEANEQFGVWGGMTYKERKQLKRRSGGRLYQDHPRAAEG